LIEKRTGKYATCQPDGNGHVNQPMFFSELPKCHASVYPVFQSPQKERASTLKVALARRRNRLGKWGTKPAYKSYFSAFGI
jgi:hypothetical protein